MAARITTAQRNQIFAAVAKAVMAQVSKEVATKVSVRVNALYEAAYQHLFGEPDVHAAVQLLISRKLNATKIAVDLTKVVESNDMGTYGLKEIGALLISNKISSASSWWRATDFTSSTITLNKQYPATLEKRIENGSEDLNGPGWAKLMSSHKLPLLEEFKVFEGVHAQLSTIRAVIFNAKNAEDIKTDLPQIADVVNKVVAPKSTMPAVIDPSIGKLLNDLKPIEVEV